MMFRMATRGLRSSGRKSASRNPLTWTFGMWMWAIIIVVAVVGLVAAI